MAKRSSTRNKPPETNRAGGFHFISAVKRHGPAFLQALLIAGAGFWVFWPALQGGWIGDDTWYIVENPLMNDPARIWKAWFQLGSWIEYYPLEETLQWEQWQLWHDETLGYHLTNVILHVISGLLIWHLFNKFGLRLAWLGGLLFAVHPMVVDSVALINEFKTSLSLPPFLLSMCFWIDYEENKKSRNYWFALALFTVAMLCKITMAMFPAVILLYAWWKRGQIDWRDLKNSLPFFAISFVLGMASIRADKIYNQGGPFLGMDVPQGDAISRFVLSGETIAFYFSRCFLPLTPEEIYPRWRVDSHSPASYLPWLVVAAVIGLLWAKRGTWGRHALLGLGFFLLMLAPFMGFKWISYMNETWILEHLLYIPILGLIGLCIAGWGEMERQLPRSIRPVGAGLVALAVGLLAWESHVYAAVFQSEASSASYVLRFNPNSTVAHNNLGVALAQMGRLSEAAEQFSTALRLDPQAPNAGLNLGKTYLKLGLIPAAIAEFQKALQLTPHSSEVHLYLGDSLMRAGRTSAAIAEYKEAVRLNSGSAWMHYNLGLVLFHHGQILQAIEEYQKALAIDPNYADAHNSLGIAFSAAGRNQEAREQFEETLRINPGHPGAQRNLALLQDAPQALK
ncbi:MAG TPA: tetratricopeptide repeat protein [Candidatus Methylacidiphilales bacterium]|nr:tetratricopeptide repeat protein [Candidatus Methylacidiphilales bacterium]